MIIIEINNVEIEITDEKIKYIKERIFMDTDREILIRNKHDVMKLSKKTHEILEDSRKQRLYEAIRDDDMLYLNSFFKNVSILELIKMILLKKHI